MSNQDPEEVTKDQWQAVRLVLKTGLLTKEIPLESVAMRPKQVWEKYINDNNTSVQFIDYKVVPVRDKFTRILRSLRKKHADGDLENEDLNAPKVLEWGKSAAKQYLKKCFREKAIAADYKAPQQVWKDHCENHAAFARMKYDEAFTRRLNTVRNDYIKKRDRMRNDLKAYIKAKKNHPTPELNARGEPQWNGSIAQKMLKEIVQNGEHKGVDPSVIWAGKAEFKVYSKQTFRDHIYQEERLLKFNNYVAGLRKEKFEKLQY